jgi:hypothetical protein
MGTYDGRAIAIAFAPTPIHNAQIAELMKQAKEAEAAGDTGRVEQLRAKGSALQTVRHLQAFGNAPVDDILDHVRDKLPEIAQAAGVCAIVRETGSTTAPWTRLTSPTGSWPFLTRMSVR